jgi:hypothetical protein
MPTACTWTLLVLESTKISAGTSGARLSLPARALRLTLASTASAPAVILVEAIVAITGEPIRCITDVLCVIIDLFPCLISLFLLLLVSTLLMREIATANVRVASIPLRLPNQLRLAWVGGGKRKVVPKEFPQSQAVKPRRFNN